MLSALLGNPLPFVLGSFKRLWSGILAIASRVNLQGWLGIACSLLLFVHFGGEARHWRKLDRNDVKARTLAEARLATANQSIANLRTASLAAQDANRATVASDTASRAQVNKESHDDYQVQLARLRADAQRLRARSAADQGLAGDDALSFFPTAAGGADGEALQGTPPNLLDAASTELQLNALIDWVAKQHAIDANKGTHP
jgi:hypothetical protein